MAAPASTDQAPSEGVGENDCRHCELITTVRNDKLYPLPGVSAVGLESHVQLGTDTMPVFDSVEAVVTPRGVANGVRLSDLTLKYEVPTLL